MFDESQLGDIGSLVGGTSGVNNTASGSTSFWGGLASLGGGLLNGATKYWGNQQNLNQQLQLQNINNVSIMNVVKYVAIVIGGILVVVTIINKLFK